MTVYQYGQFTPEHVQTIRKGIELYNAGKFWECHEELEDHWLEDTMDNARNVYWAVIQAAACLYHYENKNLAGARGLILKAKEKLLRCEKLKSETPLVYKFLSWEIFKSIIRKIPNDPSIEDFFELYQFKFSNPRNWEVE